MASDDELVGHHIAGGNGRLRLGSALEQAGFDEKTIDANAAGHALIIEPNNDRSAARA